MPMGRAVSHEPGPTVAIVGAGLMGRWHAATARRLGARIVAVVDADLPRAQALATQFGTRAFGGLDDMQRQVQPAIAHVCTPLTTHFAFSQRLLDSGCDVLCEKPLAGCVEEVQCLLDSAARAGRMVCPVHQFALQPGVCKVVRRIGELGSVSHVGFTFCSAGGERRPSAALDEVVADIVPHAFSVLARLLPGHDFAATTWAGVRTAPGELAVVTAAGGTSVSLLFSLSARPTEASAVVAGSRGTACVDFYHGFATLAGGEVSRLHKVTRPFRAAADQFAAAALNLASRALRNEPAYPGLRALVAAFYRAQAGDRRSPFAAGEILATYRARDALLRSAADFR